MNIGGLTIEMAADLARLRQDMADAKASVGNAMEGIQKAVDLAKAAFVGYLGVASINAFKEMVMGAVEATAALHDLSQQTGNSAAALAAFKGVGAYSETSLDAIATASLKLSKNLALTDEEGKGAALAIKALGLDFDSFSKLNPDQRMLAAAKALGEYEDGADKSAAAMLLFGKEGAKMLPFLSDLAEQADEVSAALTEQAIETKKLQANMADAFGDNLTAIRKNGEGWRKDLSLGLLPALYETSSTFLIMTDGAGGLKAKIGELAKDGTLAEWARGAVTALSYLVDVGQGLFSLLPMLGKVIAGVAAGSMELFSNLGEAFGKVMKGDFSGAVDSMKSGFAAVSTIGQATAEDVSKIWHQKLIGETFRDTMAGLKGVQVEGEDARKKLNLVDVLKANEAARKAEAEAAKLAAEEERKLIAAYEAAEKAGQELMAATKLKNAQLQLEVDLGRKLTPVEQENLKLTNDLESGKILLSYADEEAARASIEHSAALEREIAWMEESHKQNAAYVDATDKRIEQIQAETEKQHEANAELLLNTQQLAAVRQAKLLDLAASADRKAALLDEIDWTGQLGDQQRALAKAYRDSAAVVQEGAVAKAAKEAQDAWQKTIDSIGQGLTDSLFRAFEAGKGFFKTLWDGIVNTFKTTTLKLIISGVDGKGGIVGTVMDAIGLGSGNAGASSGGSSLSSLSSWASLGQTVYKFFGGGAGSLGSGVGSTAGGWLSSMGTSLGSYSTGFGTIAGGASGAGMGSIGAGSSGGLDALYGASGYGEGMAAGGGAGGASAGSFSWAGPAAAIIAGMLASNSAYAQGYNQHNLPVAAQVLFPEHKLDTNLLGGIIGDKWANIISGASLTSKIFQWGAGTPHRGAMYVSDGTNGYVPGANVVGDMAAGDSVYKNHSQDVEDALKTLTGGAAGILNQFSKMFGGAGGYSVGGYWSADNHDASQGNTRIWQGAQTLTSTSGHYASDPNQGYQEFTNELAAQVRKVMDTVNLPDWVAKELKGLSANATFDDIAKFISGIDAIRQTLKALDDAFTPLGGVFAKVAGLSEDATLQLAQFAGGIDQLMSKTASFVDTYYSEGEKQALAAADLQKKLTDAGITASLGSKDDFRHLVDSTDVNTEAGRKQLAALLDLGQAFAPIGDYLQQQHETLSALAAQAPQVAALQALKDGQSTSTGLQQQSADSMVKLDDTFTNVGATLEAKLQGLTESVQAGLAQVAANTADMSSFLRRWDGGNGMNTVAP